MYGWRGARLEQFTVFVGLNEIWDYGDFFTDDGIEGALEADVSLRLRGGWNISGKISDGFARFDPANYTSYTVAGPSGTMPFELAEGVFGQVSGNATISTPQFRRFDASVTTSFGQTPIFPEAAQGTVTAVRGTLNLRPTSSIRLSSTFTWTKLARTADKSEFALTMIPRVRLEVQPNRAFFFRVVGEYRSQRQDALMDPATGYPIQVNGVPAPASDLNRLRMDWLVSYEPTPGTVAFLGYGSTQETEPGALGQELQLQNNASVLKLAYLFRK